MAERPDKPLRTGFTTGTCATAAAKAATAALLTGAFQDPVQVTLPKGQQPEFALSFRQKGAEFAEAGVIKDAGDDPDVTHGCEVRVRARRGEPGSGIVFVAGEGVGIVTRPGLPVPPGEPAINPVPRQMMRDAVAEVAQSAGHSPDLILTVSVPGGVALAAQTWNPRLGIEGGISILGTTGIVRPYSCSAWIASIHRGVDVARAGGLRHVCGATGNTSEAAAQQVLGLPDHAMLDMGDFAGGMLKYLRTHPVDRVTIAGGFGKLTKLAQGALDLHSGRSQVDFEKLAELAAGAGLDSSGIQSCNTAAEALERTGPRLAEAVAHQAGQTARGVLRDAPIALDIMIVDRQGGIVAHV
jgi:cobalt-precorrin-5B (C1)-methyltransferase